MNIIVTFVPTYMIVCYLVAFAYFMIKQDEVNAMLETYGKNFVIGQFLFAPIVMLYMAVKTVMYLVTDKEYDIKSKED